ncbi:Spaetzle [Popillia japonica]|uniref:Spaetzle n=1 Tax=Popillia japonica TaxID=7064 RepID=A0AAW1J1A5_POPJA
MFGHVFSPNINLKIGEVQERNICPSKQITYIPTSGRTLSNAIKKIVNVEGYNQLVTVEICADDATPSIECKMPLGYRFICKTQYMTIRLVVYEDDNRLGVESFSIPAGCSCTYEYA